MLTLNYIFPNEEIITTTTVPTNTPFFDAWLDSMITSNPDTIFFFTTPTTDVFEVCDDYV